jgi:hypothetical protein
MKRTCFVVATLVLPSLAMADNIGGCGWGAKLMDGNKGIVPQVIAVTTNGTFGNQTFGISSGTSGCTQDGVVRSNWKVAAFIGENKTKLAKDTAVGNGETLESLANLLGMQGEQRNEFFALSQSNFDKIFPQEEVKAEDVVASFREVLEGSQSLKQFSQTI